MPISCNFQKNNRSQINRFEFSNRSIILFALILFCLLTIDAFARRIDKEKIILQLKWKNQFQFAGYYAAVEKGFYRDEGLNVEIKELEKSTSCVNEVLIGNAQYGIGNSELVIDYMRGNSIVILACVLQNSPSALLIKTSSGISSLKDLIGKTIEIDQDQSGIEIIAMLSKVGITPQQYTTYPTSFSLNNLLANKIDALEVYTSNEPFFLDKFGIPYKIIHPRDNGINFYSDCLFTSREEIKNHPERVKKFRQASLKGWKYALEHPEEISNLIQNKYKSNKTFDHLLFEAEEMRKLINPEFIEIGHCNKERWLNIVEVLSQQGLIKQTKNIDNFIYNPDNYQNLVNKRILIAIIIGLILVIAILIYYILKLKNNTSIESAQVNEVAKRNDRLMIELDRLNTEKNWLKVKS